MKRFDWAREHRVCLSKVLHPVVTSLIGSLQIVWTLICRSKISCLPTFSDRLFKELFEHQYTDYAKLKS